MFYSEAIARIHSIVSVGIKLLVKENIKVHTCTSLSDNIAFHSMLQNFTLIISPYVVEHCPKHLRNKSLNTG